MVERKRKTAEDMAREQKEISISEFFEKNKHLLGFDNPTKALLMCTKEAVDNALDACEEAGIVPDVTVKVRQMKDEKYRITIQDNGPGIVKQNIGKAFGKLLYGSKFHRLLQGRGQQGIGISACVLYSQLTTGANTKVWSKTESDKRMHYYELQINTRKNEPEIMKEEILDPSFEHGVRIEMDVTGRYRKWVEDYLKQTSIANPFAKIAYTAPDGTKTIYPRSVNELPKAAKEMKPHPYGIEFGIIQRMLAVTASRSLVAFMTNEFSSVGNQTAREICKVAKLDANAKPQELDREQIEKLLAAMQKVKVQRPPTDCLSPVGKDELEKSLKREFPNAEFIISRSREPEVYRGFPFQIEIGIVYGGDLKEDTIEVMRIANRVPLLYQAGACATTEAVKEMDWKRYGLNQQTNSLPTGKMVLIVHMASVWVPFVSESKEAIAPYPEIVKEMKLAIQDAGRELSRYLSGKRRVGEQKRRILIFERYSTEVAEALARITGKAKGDIEKKLKSFIGERVKINEAGEVEGIEGAKDVEEHTEAPKVLHSSKEVKKKEKQKTLKEEE
ncbi:MAG: DNA topoisomerase VI subunit B [Candidatus Aenigmarchaeota archaeon]|nr:DNA topoisomerase VI subunit B [Candidatus Aenigmarchaeota archaeon]